MNPIQAWTLCLNEKKINDISLILYYGQSAINKHRMNEEIANLSDLAALLALFGKGEKGDQSKGLA